MYKNGGYTGDDRMCDLVCDRYAVLQVMSRFGIALGFGDKTIAEVCAENKVDAATFLAVVNMLMNFGNGAELAGEVSVRSLTDYLHNSHGYFLDFRLPAIRRKLIEAVDCAQSDVSFAIMRFFRRVCRRGSAPHVLRGADRFSVCRVAALGREEHGLFDRHFPPPARPGRDQTARAEEHHHQILSFGQHERTQRRAVRHLQLRARTRLAQRRGGRTLHSGCRAAGGDGSPHGEARAAERP